MVSSPVKIKLYTDEAIISLQLIKSNEPSLRVLEHNKRTIITCEK